MFGMTGNLRFVSCQCKKPFKKKICNIYQILCQLKLVIIEENMDAVWKDVIQPRRVPLHDESVHNACAIIKMVIHQDHTKKPAFADYYSIFPPKVLKLKNNVCVHVSLSSEYIFLIYSI